MATEPKKGATGGEDDSDPVVRSRRKLLKMTIYVPPAIIGTIAVVMGGCQAGSCGPSVCPPGPGCPPSECPPVVGCGPDICNPGN